MGEGELQDTTTTRDADQKYLDELEAIQKAIEILSSEAVSGHANTYLPTFAQVSRRVLANLRSDVQGHAQIRAADFLQDQARNLDSRVLSALATRVRDDPFR